MDIESAANQLGKLISQTPEYKYYSQTSKDVNENEELTGLLEKLRGYETKVSEMAQKNEPLTDEFKKEYNDFMQEVQGKTLIQSLIATQENYLKLMNKVNEMIAQGVKDGGKSRIITDL